MSKATKFIQPLLVVLVIAVGVGVLMWLKSTKPHAERAEQPTEGLLVEVSTVHAKEHEVAVHAQGTVMPARRVVIQPEVTGKVIWQNDNLVPGGHVEKGETLVRIDPRDYRLALEARKADVSRARLELRLERSRQDVAKKEWAKFGTPGGETTDGGALALREPQVKTAQVAVQSAESAYDQAQRSLDKTTLKAPFNALVMNENVDVGQLAGPQTQVATLVGTDRFWVQVSVPIEALAHIRPAAPSADFPGSEARVWQQVGGQRVERTGHVLKVLPDLDPGGSMARILVGIDDPLALEGSEGSEGDEGVPLLINSYVHVDIDAPPVRGIVIPRVALREGDEVYVATDEHTLHVQPVQITWRLPDSVIVGGGLDDGARVITSQVPAPVEGMSLRVKKGANKGDHAVAEATGKSNEAADPPDAKEPL